MPDYEKMYHILCVAASRAVDLLSDAPADNMARMTLLDALHEAEELYINEGKLIRFQTEKEKMKDK